MTIAIAIAICRHILERTHKLCICLNTYIHIIYIYICACIYVICIYDIMVQIRSDICHQPHLLDTWVNTYDYDETKMRQLQTTPEIYLIHHKIQAQTTVCLLQLPRGILEAFSKHSTGNPHNKYPAWTEDPFVTQCGLQRPTRNVESMVAHRVANMHLRWNTHLSC